MTIGRTVVGVDTAKRVFQLHWVDLETGEIVDLKLTRARFLDHFANRVPCLIAMEACGGSQHWARRLQELGHEVRLLPAKMVRPFVGGNKNDAHDARAIWTAAQQPGVKAVAIKSEEQQAILALHRMRQQLVKFRTAQINCLRGLLTEYGEVMPQGWAGMRRGMALALERVSERLPAMVVETLREQWARVTRVNEEIGEIERRLKLWHRDNAASRRIAEIPGVGVLSATAAVAAMGDPSAFKSGREFAAWLGLVPRHEGTGGRVRMLGISKRGDTYLRTLLIHGARSVFSNSKAPPEWALRVAEARQTAFEYRTIARAGGDPLALKRRPDMPTFAEAVETAIGIHREGWKDAKTSEKQWRASLRDYAMPRLGQKRVDQITTADVMAVLIPHWHTKRETMQRVRQRIGTVMKWAVAQGYRDDNPTGDVISAALPKNGGVRRHQRALPFREVGAALHRVKWSGAFEPTVLAFEFLVLTACRSGEVRLATWGEVDLESATWTVPANRMKSKRDHRVPLSARSLEVLQEAREIADSSGLVFPSPRGGAISANTLSKLLRELDIDAVPHGLRSSFRDWAAECTDTPREVCELALAHVNSDRVEAAYRRTDLFDRRRALMEQWSGFVGRVPKNSEEQAWRQALLPAISENIIYRACRLH